MVYISSDGNVAERKKILRWSLLKDICYGIYDFFAMFLASVIHPPTTVTQRRTVTNYAQRHGGRSYRPSDKKQQSGGNIRGIKSLGGCSPMGGGGG